MMQFCCIRFGAKQCGRLHRWLCFLLLSVPFVAGAQTFSFVAPSGQTLRGTVVDGVLEVSRQPGVALSGALTIPASVSRGTTVYRVERIGSFASTSVLSVLLPGSVRVLADEAFMGCTHLSQVALGDSVRRIGNRAFYRCSSLQGVVLPMLVDTIGEYAFAECSSLTDTVWIPDSVRRIGRYAFSQCRRLRAVGVGAGVGVIPDECFSNCDSLSWLVLGSAVDSLGRGAFFCCRRLTSVELPEGLRYIGFGTFEFCSGLRSLTVPDSVETIDAYAFSQCTGLESIVVGSEVSSIARYAFNRCDVLDSFFMRPSVPPSIEANTFGNSSEGKVFYVSCGLAGRYRLAWGQDYCYREPDPGVMLRVEVNDSLRGFAEVVGGVRCDSIAVVRATAIQGYRFAGWSNGSMANPDTLRLTGDSVLMAVFEPEEFLLRVDVNDEEWGMATGGGVYTYGAEAELSVMAFVGYVFVRWSDGNTDNPRHVVVEGDSLFVAELDSVGTTGVSETGRTVGVYAERCQGDAVIVVLGAEGRSVDVVDRVGRRVQTIAHAGGTLRIPVRGNGIYIVKVEGNLPVVIPPVIYR